MFFPKDKDPKPGCALLGGSGPTAGKGSSNVNAVQLGLVGLGRMGFNMRERLRAGGHEVVGFARNPEISDASSLGDMVERLVAPRTVWIMIPSGAPTRQMV